MKKFGIAVKTFKRYNQVKDVISNIINSTPDLNSYEFIISADDEETKQKVKEAFPLINVIGGDRLGSGGNTNRIFNYMKDITEYFCIFDDDCYPFEKGWDKLIIQYFDSVPNINYIVHALDKDNKFYKDSTTQYVKLFEEPIQTKINGEFTSRFWHIDCNVFMAIKSLIVKYSGGIDLIKYNKHYGYWHTEFGSRLEWLKLTEYRTISLKQLDLMLHSYDYSGFDNERGISELEKWRCIGEYRDIGIES
jgi:hypothetical protein